MRALRGRSGSRSVGCCRARKSAPITVAHLVEERLHVAEGEQRGRRADWRAAVAREVGDGRAAEQLGAASAHVHPGCEGAHSSREGQARRPAMVSPVSRARAHSAREAHWRPAQRGRACRARRGGARSLTAWPLVRGPRVGIEEEGGALLASRPIEQPVERNVLVPHLRLVGGGDHLDVEELLDQPEETREYGWQREVGAELLFAEAEELLAPPLRPIAHVPQRERLGLPLLLRERAQRLELLLRGREGGLAHALEQRADGRRLTRHLAAEGHVRVRRAAEQRSHLRAQLKRAPHDRRVVVRAARAGARHERSVDCLAKRAIGR